MTFGLSLLPAVVLLQPLGITNPLHSRLIVSRWLSLHRVIFNKMYFFLPACFSLPLHLSLAQNAAGVSTGQQRVGIPKVGVSGYFDIVRLGFVLSVVLRLISGGRYTVLKGGAMEHALFYKLDFG